MRGSPMRSNPSTPRALARAGSGQAPRPRPRRLTSGMQPCQVTTYTNRFRLTSSADKFDKKAVACGAGGPEPHEQLGPENDGSMADEEKRRNRRAKQGLTEEQVRATVRQPAKLRAQSMAAPGRLRR